MSNPLESLFDPDASVRFNSLRSIRDNYHEETGYALARHLLWEKNPRVWWLSALTVLPLWLPKLDRLIEEGNEWPFDGVQTLIVLRNCGRHPIHSAKKYVPFWTSSNEWELRFASFRWHLIGGTMDAAKSIAQQLLACLTDEFLPSTSSSDLGHLIEDFYDVQLRKEALESILFQFDSK